MRSGGKKRKTQESNPVKSLSESQSMQGTKRQKTCIKDSSSSSDSSSDEDDVMSVQSTIAHKTISKSKPAKLGKVDMIKSNNKASNPAQKVLNTKRKPQNVKQPQSNAVEADSSSASEDSDSEESDVDLPVEEKHLVKRTEGMNSSSSESESGESDFDSEDEMSMMKDERVHKQLPSDENKQKQPKDKDEDSDTSSGSDESSEESSEEIEGLAKAKLKNVKTQKTVKKAAHDNQIEKRTVKQINIGKGGTSSSSDESSEESDEEVEQAVCAKIKDKKSQKTVNKAAHNQIEKKAVKQINTNKDDSNSSSSVESSEDSSEETDHVVAVNSEKSKRIAPELTRLTPKIEAGESVNKQMGKAAAVRRSLEVSDSGSSEESEQESDSSGESDDDGPTVERNQDGSQGKQKHATMKEDKGKDEEIEDEYAALKKELSNIPLEDLVKIKEKLGLKVFSQIMHGGKLNEKKKVKVFKRENKNRPMEMSSKRAVPLIKQSVAPKKKISRDPRFDDLSGEYSEEHFSRNYSFIDDIKTREKEMVSRKLKDVEDENEKKDLQFLLNRMSQQQKEKERKEKKQKLETAWRQKEKEMVKDGKTPYFLKKADKKKLVLAEKFKELKESGQMDQYLKKKHKKNAQKERRKLPQVGRPAF